MNKERASVHLNAKQAKLRTRTEALQVLRLISKSVNHETALGRISSSEGSDPFKVLISTILSARTRDPVTEAASERLFSRFPDAESLSKAQPNEVIELIKPVAFYNHKGPNIIATSKEIAERFGGKVPHQYDELLELPGVGRKTANCVLVYGFAEPAIPVDVHVHRISNRIGLVRTRVPEETERALSVLFQKKYWLDVNELFVSFGQTVCKPIGPLCESCSVRGLCNYYKSMKKSR